MCLVTSENKASMVEDAIECYKVVYDSSDGWFKSFFKGKVCEVGFEYEDDRFSEINGFFNLLPYGEGLFSVDYGFHSYKLLEDARYFSYILYGGGKVSVIRCEIPKGALYWKSFDGKTYCSNRIYIKGII